MMTIKTAIAFAGLCAAFAAAGTPAAQSPQDKSLWDAADHGDVRAVRRALRAGANVNSKDPSTGATALFAAAGDDADAKVVAELIKAGADVNMRDVGGETALMMANKTDIVRALVKAGADVNAADASGWTPLIWAVSQATTMDKGLWRAVEVLVRSGAKIGAKNKDGNSALSLAKKAKASVIVAILERGAKTAADSGR